MQKRELLLLSALLLSSLFSFGQTKIDSTKASSMIYWPSLFAGYAQGNYGFIEIGFARFSQDEDARHYNIGCKSISFEILPNSKPVLAPKLSVWGGGMTFMIFSLNLLSYTDFDNVNFVFRPEAGFGGEYFKIVWGYNAPIINTKFDRMNRHMVSGQVYLRLKK